MGGSHRQNRKQLGGPGEGTSMEDPANNGVGVKALMVKTDFLALECGKGRIGRACLSGTSFLE